jgi:hypothetical protein
MIQGKTSGDMRIFRAVAESTTRIEIACSLERKKLPVAETDPILT